MLKIIKNHYLGIKSIAEVLILSHPRSINTRQDMIVKTNNIVTYSHEVTCVVSQT